MNYLLDTNILLRYITGEPATMAAKAHDLFARCEASEIGLTLVPGVLAEAVYVLTGSVYGHSREDVSKCLIQLIEAPALDVEEREILIAALGLFSTSKLDFMDVYLVARSQLRGEGIATFDKDFTRIPDLVLAEL